MSSITGLHKYEESKRPCASLELSKCGELPPLSGELPPLSGELAPLSGELAPLSGELAPLSGELPPLSGELGAVKWGAPAAKCGELGALPNTSHGCGEIPTQAAGRGY